MYCEQGQLSLIQSERSQHLSAHVIWLPFITSSHKITAFPDLFEKCPKPQVRTVFCFALNGKINYSLTVEPIETLTKLFSHPFFTTEFFQFFWTFPESSTSCTVFLLEVYFQIRHPAQTNIKHLSFNKQPQLGRVNTSHMRPSSLYLRHQNGSE